MRAVREALARRPAPGAGGERLDRALYADPRVRRLEMLVGAQDHYLFLARQFLRASEFYGSPALFAEARRYVRAARDGARLLYPAMPVARDPDLEARNRLGVSQQGALDLRDVETRIAIQAARFSRDPADIDAAQALVDAGFSPVLRKAADELSREDDFCNSAEGDGLDEIRAACRDEDDFLRRFASFWRNQALVDTLMAADPVHYAVRPDGPPSATTAADYRRRPPGEAAGDLREPRFDTVDTALAIFEPGRMEGMSNPNFTGPHEEQIALHSARAEAYSRFAEAAANDAGAAGDALSGALREFVEVTRLAPAAEHPGRFRQAATRFVALLPAYEAAERRHLEEDYQPDAAFARQAAYFRAVLSALDRIAVGAD
jgi:hypothetical protein